MTDTESKPARTDPRDPEQNSWRHPRWAAAFRFSAVKMLVALMLFIITAPFVDQYPGGRVVSSVVMTGVLITATLAMGSRRWTFVVAVFLVVPALAARWSVHLWPDLVPPEVFSIAGMLFVGFAAMNVLYFTLRTRDAGINALCAGISCYLLLGIFWAFAYTLVASISPDAFVFFTKPAAGEGMSSFTAIYFSFITLSSVGYGDIVPVAPAVRMLAMVEAMTGTFYVAVMIARLVALHLLREAAK